MPQVLLEHIDTLQGLSYWKVGSHQRQVASFFSLVKKFINSWNAVAFCQMFMKATLFLYQNVY